MSDRILGPSGSKRRGFWRRRFVFPSLIAIGAAGLVLSNALAVHDTGRFELDGNATTATSDDWDEVCHEVTITNDPNPPNDIPDECASASNTNGATAVSWTDDGVLNNTIFTGGGSKDPQDITNWAWKNAGGLPQKDNLLHSFAVRYSLPNDPVGGPTACPSDNTPAGDPTKTCEVLFFGSDRFANDGDAQQGFWFLQDEDVALGDTPKGGGTSFTGKHENNDLLVISDFSNGGDVSTITVYKWDDTCAKGVNDPDVGECGDANLRLLATSEAANCLATNPALPAGDPFCGIVNPVTTDSPWSFTDTVGSDDFRQGEFFEGGINLSAVGLAGECFAAAASESRSSTSTTATLKDFVLGEFAQCGISTEQKWFPQDTAQVTGGAGTVTFNLYENGTCDPAGLVDIFTDGSAPYETNQNTHSYTADTTISWSATFTPTGQDPIPVEDCERSDLTIDNEASEFTPPSGVQRTLRVNVTGTGTVTGDGINCPNDCVQTYPDLTSVTLTAAPADSTYNGWGGDCSTANPGSTCGLTMNADKTVSATFPP